MRNISAVLISLLFSGAVQAQEPPTVKVDDSTQTRSVTLRLASLVEPGETLDWGDFIRVERPFGAWTLLCDWRPSRNKRICSTEQTVNAGNSGLIWRIAIDSEHKPIVLFVLPADLDRQGGLRLSFSGLEKSITGSEWTCNGQSCMSAFPFSDFVQAAILNSKEMQFSFRLLAKDAAPTEVRALASMEGFTTALEAAAKDPFGKYVPLKKQEKAADLTSAADKNAPPVVLNTPQTNTDVPAKQSDKVEQKSPPQQTVPAKATRKQSRNIVPRDGLY